MRRGDIQVYIDIDQVCNESNRQTWEWSIEENVINDPGKWNGYSILNKY